MSARLLIDHARELAGMPPEWDFYRLENCPRTRAPFYFAVSGAVAPPFKSGPRKGRPNFARMDPATDETVIITHAEQDAWEAAWEARTGLCRGCVGDGRQIARVSVTEGTTYRPCPTCGGSGKAKGVQS